MAARLLARHMKSQLPLISRFGSHLIEIALFVIMVMVLYNYVFATKV